MTTAHRPTFNPARGGNARSEGDLSKLSAQYSSKDMPSHTTLKYRQPGQGTTEEIRRRDLRRELEDKERSAARERRSTREAASTSSSAKKPRLEEIAASTKDLDADEPLDEINDSDDDDSEDDDTAALMEELARIKKERAAEKEVKLERERQEQERIRMDNVLHGNPLLNFDKEQSSEGFQVKRRWDDDVVFKNCAKGLDERKKEPTFINDAIRSEFHRKFMDKYIK